MSYVFVDYPTPIAPVLAALQLPTPFPTLVRHVCAVRTVGDDCKFNTSWTDWGADIKQ